MCQIMSEFISSYYQVWYCILNILILYYILISSELFEFIANTSMHIILYWVKVLSGESQLQEYIDVTILSNPPFSHVM